LPDRIRIGLLGAGHGHAGGKLRVLEASPEFELAGVAEPNAEVRERCRGSEPFASARWVSESELLEDRSVVAVAVEGRVQDNLGLARRALEAGKHVHLDKPAGDSLQQFRAVLDLAREQDLLLQMGYQFRYNTGFVFVREAVREGWLGEVFSVHGTISSSIALTAREGLAAFPGGMMFDLGCHLIDALVDLLGRPHTITPFLRHDSACGDTLADNTVAVFQFERAVAVIETSAMEVGASQRRQFAVCGSEGTAVVQPIEPPTARLCLRQATAGYQSGWQSVPVENVPRYVRDFEEFAACIRGARRPSYDYHHDEIVQAAVLRASGMGLE
jgi:predicted dehydrogenase